MDDPNQLDQKNKEGFRRFRGINFKTSLIILMVGVICRFSLTAYKINEISTEAFAVYLGDEEVGIVREKENISHLLEKIEEEFCDKYNINCIVNEELKFESINAEDNDIDNIKELRDKISSKLTFLVSGYVLLIDDVEVGVLKTREDAEEAIKRFKESVTETDDEDSKVKDIKILEDVKIVKKQVALSDIGKVEDALKFIETGSEEVRTHIVEAGESFWTIAKLYDMDVYEIIDANPDLIPEKVYPGEEISLKVPKTMLTIETIEERDYYEDIDYSVEIQVDNSMYKTQEKVKTKGIKGKNKIVTKIVKHNGRVVDEEIISKEVVEKPVNEIIVKGTKEKTITTAANGFSLPTRGRISSGYGSRGGRLHRGIDIAASIGTPIAAADGGTVTFVGPNGSYGNLVVIDHNNGYVTKYAHCSEIYVSNGQKVHKGDKIAAVGVTGNARGAHLHFEVLKDGNHVNPSVYLGR